MALRYDNHHMNVDSELVATRYSSKGRAKFFNRIWHPYLSRNVLAMQWLILIEGLPVGAWRKRKGHSSDCQLCPTGTKKRYNMHSGTALK